MIVVIKARRMALAGPVVGQRRTIDQQDVHPSVVVVIESRSAAAHGFDDVELLQAAAGEVKINAGGARDIGKQRRTGSARLYLCLGPLRSDRGFRGGSFRWRGRLRGRLRARLRRSEQNPTAA